MLAGHATGMAAVGRSRIDAAAGNSGEGPCRS